MKCDYPKMRLAPSGTATGTTVIAGSAIANLPAGCTRPWWARRRTCVSGSPSARPPGHGWCDVPVTTRGSSSWRCRTRWPSRRDTRSSCSCARVFRERAQVKAVPEVCGVYCATANPVRRTRLSAPPALDSWLFPSPLLRAQQSRGHVTPDCVGRTFKAWVAQIGTIDSELLGPDGTPAPFDPALITPYALRHTYAQRHADAGVPVDVPKELMGQVAVATTMGYYRVGLKRKQQAIYSVGSLALARASHDGGPRGRRRPVRQGQQPAGRPGRDRADTKRVERAAEADGAAAAVATQAHAGGRGDD